ncbi:MAG: NADH-quinone oxidoreductase subunit NuoB, partial [Muribaculaceae bacterium]|nr:NADH-quinone oxidoreductase subunit NuoB [Muribaculaceae bacterium]
PRPADFMMVAGTIVNRIVPVFRRLFDQLSEPKYVIACGGCAISGGPFRKSYHVAKGIEDIVPVDVFVPGCPPCPEAMIYGIMQLSRKVKVERFFGGVNRQEKQKDFVDEHPIAKEAEKILSQE